MKLSHAVAVLATVCLVGSAVAYTREDSDLESSDVDPVVEESLLDLASASKARRDSYQSNVGTVYTHLNEIIRKILVHKKAWSVKYESDLTRVAKELAAKVSAERTARSGKDKADAALAVAKSEADRKNKAWLKAHASLQQKKKDAEKERSDLKVLFTKGNGLKAGEIAMIVKIRCMLSTFNKDDKYKCDDMKAVIADAKAALSEIKSSGCTRANWYTSFDKKGWSKCPAGKVMKGWYRNDCDKLHCLEEAECCDVPGGSAAGHCYTANWWTSLDKEGWSKCKEGYYMAGLHRNDCNELHCLEEAQCCRGDTPAYTKCYEQTAMAKTFDKKGWANCKTGYSMVGIWRNKRAVCNGLGCIEKMKCCHTA